MGYKAKTKYTPAELDNAALRDLLNDAECSDKQAVTGPFYPERGITADGLKAYATACRQKAAQYAQGGAHDAVLQS